MNTTMTQPIKWHGGKHYLASKIVTLMPPHIHYVEPFAGGLSVLLAKDPEGISEVVNDLNGELINFWRVLAHPSQFERMRRVLEATPFSQDAYNRAQLKTARRKELWPDGTPDGIEQVSRAIAFFILCRQSLAGRMHAFAPLSKTRTRRGMNEQASAWINAIDGLPTVHARLRRVAILNQDACKVMQAQDGPRTLFYCDPPYLQETRIARDVYAHEMTAEQHREFLAAAKASMGKVMISGYRSELYDGELSLSGWSRHEFSLPNNAAGGESKRRMTECLWCNF